MSPPAAHDALYTKPDLHRAAAESAVRITLSDRLAGLRNGVAAGAGAAAARLRRGADAAFELIIAAGDEPPGTESPVALYAGTGANRDWCLSNVLPGYRVRTHIRTSTPAELAIALAETGAGADIRFSEGLAGPAFETATSSAAAMPVSFLMPAWIKQRLRLVGDWPRQLAGLRRDTRQEVSRVLRKYGYSCRLSRDRGHHADFYDRLYTPYVSRRFGAGALVVDRSRFLAQCRRGVLLQLAQQDEVIGAALLRPLGRTLAVVWSALDAARDPSRLRGAPDAMDYFSLLYAHLRGCRWLDFGPSRPDLFDGPLRYKAKWGAEVHPGLAPQAEIRCTCVASDPARLDFLTQHAFLEKARGGLRGVFFVGGDTEPEALRSRLSTGLVKGVDDYRVIALSPPDERLRPLLDRIDARVTLEEPRNR